MRISFFDTDFYSEYHNYLDVRILEYLIISLMATLLVDSTGSLP